MKKTLLAVAAAFAAIGAQAATISDSYGQPIALNVTEINETGQLDRFNSALGTLTGATLTLFGGARFEFTGNNVAAQAQRATLTSSVDLFWTSDLAALNGVLVAAPQPQISLSATSGSQQYAVGETKAFGPFDTSNSAVFDLSGILAALTGTGTFGVTCESSSGLAVSGGGGNINTTQTTVAGCGASISYEYTAVPPPVRVPEPGSLALVGLALAGVTAASRRRKA